MTYGCSFTIHNITKNPKTTTTLLLFKTTRQKNAIEDNHYYQLNTKYEEEELQL